MSYNLVVLVFPNLKDFSIENYVIECDHIWMHLNYARNGILKFVHDSYIYEELRMTIHVLMVINYYYHEKLNILKLFKVVKKLIYKLSKVCNCLSSSKYS